MTKTRIALGALMLSGVAFATAPAVAGEMGMSVSYGQGYQKPCRFYVERDLPAPQRCYRAFYDVYGPQALVRGGMVFRDRESFAEFQERGGFRDYDRWAERQEDSERREYGSRNGQDTRQEREWADRERDHSSGGASYGHRTEAPESPSGGASYGHHTGRPEPYSGGASGQ